jgi:periplasmic divalent cation tolerance protein
MSDSIAMVITTVASAQDADRLAADLLDQSLAACVQVDGPIFSHYRWKGQRERANEYRLMIKTAQSVWPRLRAALTHMHPYDEPEIILVPVEESSDGYRKWVIEETADSASTD